MSGGKCMSVCMYFMNDSSLDIPKMNLVGSNLDSEAYHF